MPKGIWPLLLPVRNESHARHAARTETDAEGEPFMPGDGSINLESIVVHKTIDVCSEQMMRNPTHEGGLAMRKVVASELVSLDGVMEKPEQWSFSYSNDEMEEANDSGVSLVGAPSSRVGCAVEKAFGGEHRRKERP